MDLTQKAWDITMALIAAGKIDFDMNDYHTSIARIEEFKKGIEKAYAERNSARVDEQLDQLRGFRPE
ncbi:TPA: hypothetical protein ACGPQK_002674 [Pseudomonas aeruginosa]